MPYGKHLNRNHQERFGRPSDRAAMTEKRGFEISRDDLQAHIKEYLKSGGEIHPGETDPAKYYDFEPYKPRYVTDKL